MRQPIFEPVAPLPRGPHSMSREEVAASQRLRLMRALVELLADGGWEAVTIGRLAQRAGVSRAAFYAHFASKEDCLLAGYDRFAATLLDRLTADLPRDLGWEDFVALSLERYLGVFVADPTAARAFVIELDGCGPAARARRRAAVHAFAQVIADRHAALRERDPALGPLPDRAYLAMALAVRELVRDALETGRAEDLAELGPDIVAWLRATVRGA
jgi:AcrR family transcriptional regulator